jgi:serine/threonine-protein kinase
MAGRVFVSYTRKDCDFALWLTNELTLRGYQVWIDSGSIQIGQIWREEIVQGIESCQFFLLILSSNSIKSTNVVKELSLAESSGKVILPVLIEEVEIPLNMRYQLSGVQFMFLGAKDIDRNLGLLLEGMGNRSVEIDREFPSSLLLGREFEIMRPLSPSDKPSTYLLNDRKKNKNLVLKIFPSNEELNQVYESEVKELEKINNPGIPQLLEYFPSQNYYCLIFEYINATPWTRLQLDHHCIVPIVKQVLDILAEVHQKGMIHGNVRPDNLLLSADFKQSFIVDPALAKSKIIAQITLSSINARGVWHPLSENNERQIGKELYWTSEFARFSSLSPSTDLYALGVSILVLCSGMKVESLYDKNQSSWRIEACHPSIHHWLLPMLKESAAERVHSVEEVLEIIDYNMPLFNAIPNSSSPWVGVVEGSHRDQPRDQTGDQLASNLSLSSLTPFQGRVENEPPLDQTLQDQHWSKQLLLHELSQQIGPIAQLLMQACPELLTEADRDTLRSQLQKSGLDLANLDYAFSQALVVAKASPPETPCQHEGVKKKVDELPRPLVNGQSSSLLEWLRQEIGPMADFIWDRSLEDDLARTPSRAQARLEEYGVPESTIRELVARRASHPSQGSSVSSQYRPKEELQNDQKFQMVLLESLGPMAHALLEEFSNVMSSKRKLELILERLREYGIDRDLIQQISAQLTLASDR